MSKVKTKWIEDAAVTNDKLNSDVAGDGLAGGAGSALAVDISPLTEETSPAETDLLVMERSSDGGLRKVQKSNFTAGPLVKLFQGVDTTGGMTLTNVAQVIPLDY